MFELRVQTSMSFMTSELCEFKCAFKMMVRRNRCTVHPNTHTRTYARTHAHTDNNCNQPGI